MELGKVITPPCRRPRLVVAALSSILQYSQLR